jgi:chromosome segregation ATPase
MDHLRELLLLAEPLDVTQTLGRCLNVVFTLQGLRYNTAAIIGQRLEAARRDWQQLSAAHQQLNFTLTQMQQENGRLRARKFQLELERCDRLQRIVDLEAKVHTLEENVDAYEIERLTLLQNIADMQHQVEEAEVQVAALRAGRKTRSSQTRSNSLVSSSARLSSLDFLNELSLGFSSVV